MARLELLCTKIIKSGGIAYTSRHYWQYVLVTILLG